MAVLVGNDFIPSIPLFCGNKSVLEDIMLLYMEVLPTLDGYINENGQLNLSRFDKLMKRLASLDLKYFNDIHADVRSPKKKHDRKRRGQQANRDEQRQKNFIAYKKAYYSNKMGLCKVDK
jgi:5'-3' exonuclease